MAPRARRILFGVCVCLHFSGVAHAADPLGPPFQVNTGIGDLNDPRVASDSAGNFVVVWGVTTGRARLFDAAGTPLTGELTLPGAGAVAMRAGPIGPAFQVGLGSDDRVTDASAHADGGNFVTVMERSAPSAAIVAQLFERGSAVPGLGVAGVLLLGALLFGLGVRRAA